MTIEVTYEQGTGFSPRIVRIKTTSTLSQVLTAGWYNNTPPNQLLPTDQVLISYAEGTTNAETDSFGVDIVDGVVSLLLSESGVTLPVTTGDFAVFADTTGTLEDLGYLPSDATKTNVVMASGSITLNHVAQFSDTNGTIKDGGVLGTAAAKAASDNTKATVASVSAATVLGNLAKFADTSGTVADQGVAFKSVAQAAVAGGAAAQTVSDAFCTSASCVVASWNDTSNAVSIQKVAAGNGSFVVTSSGDPGASHLNYIITK